jgi:anaerobic magnesium-protoporphyrin IX monomethyl ester cyclase
MKNITLVVVGRDTTLTSPNLGVCYLASYLREKGYEVQLVDEISGEDFFSKIKKTDIVGLSSISAYMNRSFKLAEEIKKKFDVPIVMGGPHASVLPELTLGNPNVDYVVLGEGELPLLELMSGKDPKDIKALGYKEGGEIKVNHGFNMIQDIDTIPFPARDLLNMKFYLSKKDSFPGMDITSAPIFTSRGCPYRCSFCSANVVRGRGVRYNSADYVIEELQHVISTYRPQSVFFWDDLFISNKNRLFEICDRMIKLGLNKKIVWTCNSRADSLDDETMRIIKEAGCVQLQIGFESGSQKMLDYLKCKTIKVEQNQAAVDMCKKYNMRVLGFFIIGNPNETKEDIDQTINFIKSNPIDFTALSTATPYPGTQMWDDYLKMYDITDISKINWDSFWHGKSTFFVPKEREAEFNDTWKKLSMDISVKNYSGSSLKMFKRAIKRPTASAKMVMSYMKNRILKK